MNEHFHTVRKQPIFKVVWKRWVMKKEQIYNYIIMWKLIVIRENVKNLCSKG